VGRAIGLFSTKTITPKGLGFTMSHLRAERKEPSWVLSRDNRRVYVELASEELDLIPAEIILEVADELGDVPMSMVTVIFNDSREDNFEWRMARAVGSALAEHYPIVWHDYSSQVETIYAPGQRPVDESSRRRK
jgi:hypothetical protein